MICYIEARIPSMDNDWFALCEPNTHTILCKNKKEIKYKLKENVSLTGEGRARDRKTDKIVCIYKDGKFEWPD